MRETVYFVQLQRAQSGCDVTVGYQLGNHMKAAPTVQNAMRRDQALPHPLHLFLLLHPLFFEQCNFRGQFAALAGLVAEG